MPLILQLVEVLTRNKERENKDVVDIDEDSEEVDFDQMNKNVDLEKVDDELVVLKKKVEALEGKQQNEVAKLTQRVALLEKPHEVEKSDFK